MYETILDARIDTQAKTPTVVVAGKLNDQNIVQIFKIGQQADGSKEKEDSHKTIVF